MPTSDSRIKRVGSFHELATTPFGNGINALCWERTLPGDFTEVVKLLSAISAQRSASSDPCRASVLQTPSEPSDEPNEGIVTIQPSALSDQLSAPGLSPSTRAALTVLLDDLHLLRSIERDPVLNLIHAYPRDEDGGPIPTDVFSFHADSAPIPADTWLCTYHGPPSEGLRNEDAVRKVDVPEIRAALLKLHAGPDDESFQEFLHENHYDLHYAEKRSVIRCQQSASDRSGLSTLNPQLSTAAEYSFGRFHLWRIACEYPNAPVPPCIHRAPLTAPGDPPRLLLIS